MISFNTNLDGLITNVQTQAKCVLQASKDGYFNVTVKPKVSEKTLQQLRAFHALVHAIWQTGETSYDSEIDLKNTAKLASSQPDFYIYLDGEYQITVKDKDSVPFGAYFVAVPKSMSDFTLTEAQGAIEFLLELIREAGISSRKIDEIIMGMEGGYYD